MQAVAQQVTRGNSPVSHRLCVRLVRFAQRTLLDELHSALLELYASSMRAPCEFYSATQIEFQFDEFYLAKFYLTSFAEF